MQETGLLLGFVGAMSTIIFLNLSRSRHKAYDTSLLILLISCGLGLALAGAIICIISLFK